MMTIQTTCADIGREANDNQVNDNTTARQQNRPPQATPPARGTDPSAKAPFTKPQPPKKTEH